MSVRSASGGVRRKYPVKYSKKGYYKRSNASAQGSLAEFIVMQCVVSGIILCLMLIICIVKTPFTISLRQEIKTALTGNLTGNLTGSLTGNLTGNIYEDGSTEDILTMAGSITNSVKSLFMKKNPEKDQVIDDASSYETVPVFSQNEDFRIDEDILESIYSGNPNYSGSEIKNEMAPPD